MNKKAFIFLILAVLGFFVSFALNFHKINIPYFGGLYKEIQTDIIFKKEPPKVYYQDKEIKKYIKIDENHYLFKTKYFGLVKKIEIKNIENIQKIVVYVGNEGIFPKNNLSEIEIDNNKNLLDKASIAFLSYFYNPQYYIFSYIFLFLFLYNFQFNCSKTKIGLIFLFSLSFLLRMAQLNNIPFWDDEIYVLSHTNAWLDTLKDPGNPPLYFILFKIYRALFQNPDFYRFSSVLIGVLFNIAFYFYIKTFLSKKTAIISALFVCVNIVLIYFSQEIRCYALLMLLALINSYFLFKFNNKTKFKYLISSLALLYTHFYGAFFVFYNFIFGLTIFKNKDKIKKFILVNVLSFVGFLPELIYKKMSLSGEFNSWLQIPKMNDYSLVVETLFGNVFVFVAFVVAILILFFKGTKKNRLFVKYNSFAILFVFLCAIAFSYLIKPIFCYRYFYVVFPCVLFLFAIIFKHLLSKKYGLILIFLLFITLNFRLNQLNLFCNHNLYLNFIKQDINEIKNNYIFMSDTVVGYKDFEIKGAKMLYLPVNFGIDTLDIRKYEIKKPSVVYLLNFYLDDYALKVAKNIELYKTPLGVFCKFEL
ncbi:MAG: glycosyltransferase family 39 protein [Candidatus Gastranaerophilales bacterium]|nr:glycosyltransferase family 39 protein [Candidatus Gastranaerophilales bacterium]